jgi:hypothetical protein
VREGKKKGRTVESGYCGYYGRSYYYLCSYQDEGNVTVCKLPTYGVNDLQFNWIFLDFGIFTPMTARCQKLGRCFCSVYKEKERM